MYITVRVQIKHLQRRNDWDHSNSIDSDTQQNYWMKKRDMKYVVESHACIGINV